MFDAIDFKWNDEEKEAIEQLEELSKYCALRNIDREDDTFGQFVVAIQKIKNLTQKQQKELEKLKSKNKELLEKLRNRVKEVKKLTKYSLYKKEFTKLNSEIEKKDKIIDLISDKLAKAYHYKFKQCSLKEKEQNNIDCDKYKDCTSCVKQYFEREVENEQ